MRKRSAAASKDATVSKFRSILPVAHVYDDGDDDGDDDEDKNAISDGCRNVVL